MELIINQTQSISDLGFEINGYPKIPSPVQRVERVTVDGRDGELIIKKGYSNIVYKIELNALEDSVVNPLFRELKSILRKAETIQLSNDKEIYYKVLNAEFGDMENELEVYGLFEVSFELSPHAYYTAEDAKTVTTTLTFDNLGFDEALPEMTVFGSGTCKFSVNGAEITVNGVSEYVTIDSQIEECYKGPVSMNSMMIGTFPKLVEGKNTVKVISGITKIEIKPRWRAI